VSVRFRHLCDRPVRPVWRPVSVSSLPVKGVLVLSNKSRKWFFRKTVISFGYHDRFGANRTEYPSKIRRFAYAKILTASRIFFAGRQITRESEA
ncbi:hypothetical protein, partial [Litorivita pollutaquae]|uniref:hypothetical protein n=1 Tax=Litorivita pollutaquae TaxID=2200892 RepID=UPI0019553BB9